MQCANYKTILNLNENLFKHLVTLCLQSSSDFSLELPSPERSVEANESIISLLLKLHSHLSGTPDSFNPEEPEVNRDSRIGDGPFFISKVLRRIMELDSFCR